MRKSKGAVTVFLIIVLFATTLLGGLFIDASRILLAKRAVRNAADSAARSALAGYDEHMAAEYGLFAVNAAQAEADFKRYFQNNIALSKNDGFDILSLNVADDAIKVEVSSPLTDTNILQDQMNEYAKYRAVVDSTIGVIQKFSGIFGGDKASKVQSTVSNTKQLADGLKDKALELSGDVRTIISGGVDEKAQQAKGEVVGSLTNESSAHYTSGSFTDAELGFDKMDAEIDRAKQRRAELESQLQAYNQEQAKKMQDMQNLQFGESENLTQNGANQLEIVSDSADMGQVATEENDFKGTTFPDQVQAEINDLNAQIGAAESKLNSTKQQIRSQSQVVQQKNSELATAQNNLTLAKQAQQAAKAKVNELDSDIYDKKYRYDLANAHVTDEVRQLQQAYQTERENLKNFSGSAEDVAAQKDRVKQAGEALETAVDALNDNIADDSQKIKTELAKAKEAKKAADDLVTHCQQVYDAVKNARDEAMNKLQRLYDNCGAAETSAGHLEVPSSISDSAKNRVSNALKNTTNFLGQINDALTRIVDESKKTDVVGVSANLKFDDFFGFEALGADVWKTVNDLVDDLSGIVSIFTTNGEVEKAFFFTGYVFSTHTYLTSQTERGNHYFEIGEVEYILQYNLEGENGKSQLACVASSVLDVAKLRLLINWITYMVKSTIPEWISRIITALVQALIRTLEDLVSMIFTTEAGESAPGCPLSPAFDKIKLSYSDHLRLKMMIRAVDSENREKMFKRMLTLMSDTMEDNGWDDFASLNTRLKADVTVDVDLVMLTLPMFEKILPPDNQILQDGKFRVHETVSMGY